MDEVRDARRDDGSELAARDAGLLAVLQLITDMRGEIGLEQDGRQTALRAARIMFDLAEHAGAAAGSIRTLAIRIAKTAPVLAARRLESDPLTRPPRQ